jgi:leucyl-tRNA synthetase
MSHLENNMEIYGGCAQAFKDTAEWLEHWPCTRSKGLGTQFLSEVSEDGFPLLIDSLSDSTIYMAFYCVSHLITKIPVENCNWDYIFSVDNDIHHFEQYDDLIQTCKRQFQYWYPCDMRVSGKDLVNNHLVMALHNHYAVWGDKYMPKGFGINGHILGKIFDFHHVVN